MKNMVKYKKIFLDKMKSLFSYLIKFFENSSIIPKKYLDNCVIVKPDQQLIIITIYYKCIFLTNNSCQKV